MNRITARITIDPLHPIRDTRTTVYAHHDVETDSVLEVRV